MRNLKETSVDRRKIYVYILDNRYVYKAQAIYNVKKNNTAGYVFARLDDSDGWANGLHSTLEELIDVTKDKITEDEILMEFDTLGEFCEWYLDNKSKFE